MKHPTTAIVVLLASLCLAPGVAWASGEVDRGTIRLGGDSRPASPRAEPPADMQLNDTARRGFDYAAFQARLESLWFQRKTLLASGRKEDAVAQLGKIRALCAEDGVRRLQHVAGALIAEAQRHLDDGNASEAISALGFAQTFDPGRSQIHLIRAMVHWRLNTDPLRAIGELFMASQATVFNSIRDLRMAHRFTFILGLGLTFATGFFALLMLLRHGTPLRHEIEEWSASFLPGGLSVFAGWLILLLPLVIWIGAAWAAIYWMAILFRFMRRGERLATVLLLCTGILVWPLYAMGVKLYGTTADPAVRATLTTVGADYDPDRIVELRGLVESHPKDTVYRFLLAGQYKNGRYLEEAFEEYRRLLELEPTRAAAHVNLGNIFYTTGQYSEAIANYRRALDLEPDHFLAYFNLHLAQSEDFRFTAADKSLTRARQLDSDRVATMLSQAGNLGTRVAAQDASVQMASLWSAALGGRRQDRAAGPTPPVLGRSTLFNPYGIACLVGLVGCLAAAWIGRDGRRARPCIRCGRPFCFRCKRSQKGQEYCSQCVHLYVLRDGLAPLTKSKKLYEVARHERRTRITRRLVSILLPGSMHVLGGRTGRGLLLITCWSAAWIAAWPEALPINQFAGMSFSSDILLGSTQVRALHATPVILLVLLAVPALWLAGNAWQLRRKES